MNTEREFLLKLAKAKTEDEKTWLTTKRLIDSLPEEMQTLVYSAAIPHWFDENILRALNPKLSRKIKRHYSKLQELPFVEKFENRGHNIHELTRRLVLDYLWKRKKNIYRSLSQNLVVFYENSTKKALKEITSKIKTLKNGTKKTFKEFQRWIKINPEIVNALSPDYQNEMIYHLVIANPAKGNKVFTRIAWLKHDQFDLKFSELNALLFLIHEHIAAGRVKGKIIGWERFFRGLLYYYRYDYKNAKLDFTDVINKNYPDKKLNADAHLRLGDVHINLLEIPEALVCYKKALSLYRSAKFKNGEAHCIFALGNMHKDLSEFYEARVRYGEALPIYRAIKNKLGEANCIRALGDIHLKLSELPKAQACYEEALPIYRAIKNKLGEANCMSSLGDVHMRLSELPKARVRYEEALPIYRTINDKLGEINCISSLGEIHVELKEFDAAINLHEQAIKIAETLSPRIEAEAINSMANAYEMQKKFTKALELYMKAIQLSPRQAHLWRNRARLYIKIKEPEKASHDLEEATRLQPDNAYLSLRRGDLAILLNNYSKAIEHFSAALDLFPRMNYAYFGIGIANLRMQKNNEALIAYQKGLEFTESASELEDPIEELENLSSENPSLEGINSALELLRRFSEKENMS